MGQVMTFVQVNERWLYLLLGLFSLWYLRSFLQAHQGLHKLAYVLERETASRERAVSLSVLMFLASAGGFVYLTARNIIPNAGVLLSPQSDSKLGVPNSVVSTVSPEVLVLPGQPRPTLSDNLVSLPQNTPVPAAGIGCDNPLAVIVTWCCVIGKGGGARYCRYT